MAPNERAQKNHDELFPGHVSTLAVTDPELIELFDNFAFDEVLIHGSLDARTRLMVQLASMIASQALREYRVMIRPALTVGVTPVEIKEIVYQAVPYYYYVINNHRRRPQQNGQHGSCLRRILAILMQTVAMEFG
jgi:4-carboxymuconolactone decarboxylase